MTKNKNIYFYPFRTDINSYPLRMQHILSDSYVIKICLLKHEAIKLLSFKFIRKDIAIINWLENGFVSKKWRDQLSWDYTSIYNTTFAKATL